MRDGELGLAVKPKCIYFYVCLTSREGLGGPGLSAMFVEVMNSTFQILALIPPSRQSRPFMHEYRIV